MSGTFFFDEARAKNILRSSNKGKSLGVMDITMLNYHVNMLARPSYMLHWP